MSGFGFGRNRSGDRFGRMYSTQPAMRRFHHEHPPQQQRQVKSKTAAMEENRGRSGDRAAFPKAPPCELRERDSTNLDRFLESITPLVPAMCLSKSRMKGMRNLSGDCEAYFNLGDLWETFREWSAYGAGVPVLMNGRDSVVQYYVPYLSGIQLYIDPSKPSASRRRPGEECDAESSQESNSDNSDGQPNNIQTNSRSQVDLNRLSLKDDDAVVSNLPGLLVSSLSSRCPELNTYNSCDLLPSSWVSVAWYPIYRIPMGPTLRDLEACFLTFHYLSTAHQSVSHFQPQVCAPKLGKINGSVDSSPKLPLPVFGLASYKFKGPMWAANELEERNKQAHYIKKLIIGSADYKLITQITASLLLIIPAEGDELNIHLLIRAKKI
ncbi:hypothetical protein Sjap_006909 [Stephania japonica]|uniref:Uncharacterized protein n=1 Tax=Stephania japonica TaxID=461633 RepID=A0AAP0K6U0_9MAGN